MHACVWTYGFGPRIFSPSSPCTHAFQTNQQTLALICMRCVQIEQSSREVAVLVLNFYYTNARYKGIISRWRSSRSQRVAVSSVSLHTPRETAAARRKRGLLAVAACCGPGPPEKEKPACSPLLPAAAAHLHLHLHGAAAAPPVSQTGRAGRHLIRGKNAAFS